MKIFLILRKFISRYDGPNTVQKFILRKQVRFFELLEKINSIYLTIKFFIEFLGI